MSETTQTTETATTTPPVAETRPNLAYEVVKRAVPRVLPCKLTDEEFVRISRTRVAKESERDQLVADAKLDAEKRKDQIKEYSDEIAKMGRELHTGFQDRTIKTDEVFEKDDKGNCWIVVYRHDTGKPTGERWPASASEMQRYLPSDKPGVTLLEDVAKAQRSAQPETGDATPEPEVPSDLPDEKDDGEDDDDEGGGDEDGKAKRGGRRGKGK